MKPKILFIMHMPPPVHGAAIVGKNIHDSKVINEAFDCHYFNLTLAKNLEDIGKSGVKKLITFIRQLWNIRKVVKKTKPSLCYVTPNACGGAFYKDFVVVMLLKYMNQKIVVHYHNKGVESRQDRWFDNWLYKCFFKGLKVILLADALYEDIKKYVDRKDVFVCPNGIPQTLSETQLEYVIERRTSVRDKAKILYLSNMMTEKGIWILLDACKMLKADGVDFECNYVGNWGDTTYEEFCEHIKDYRLENYVKVNGPKYGRDKIPYLESANIFAFPTYYHGECFSLVLLEAMEYAIPCISTFEGGIPSIITNGKNGLLVHQKCAKELYESIKSLAQNPKKAERIGLNGRKSFKDFFTLQSFEKRLIGILENSLNS